MNTTKLAFLGIAIVLLGTALIAVGSSRGPASTGFVVFLGPVPIVFGSGPDSSQLIVVGVVIAVAMVVISFLSFFGQRSRGRQSETES